jgi:DNA helicase-2/ATP-dependent DNA helicase PcrA
VFSCSKIEQKQLNTWVSFQSAEQPLLGQFSVSGNILATRYWDIAIKNPASAGFLVGLNSQGRK